MGIDMNIQSKTYEYSIEITYEYTIKIKYINECINEVYTMSARNKAYE